jgi:hypothetical protein
MCMGLPGEFEAMLIHRLGKVCAPANTPLAGKSSQGAARRTSTALVPPNANEFDSMVRTGALTRATLAT